MSARHRAPALPRGGALYVLDEPTTGLHPTDVERLFAQLHAWIDAGNSAVLVDHHVRVAAASDCVIEIGPGAAAKVPLTSFRQSNTRDQMSTALDELRENEKTDLLARALSLPVADAVCWLLVYNNFHRKLGPPPYCTRIPLSDLGNKGSAEDLEYWQKRAVSLVDDGVGVAESLSREDDLERRDAIMDAYRSRHPGYAPETYDEAMSQGVFWSR